MSDDVVNMNGIVSMTRQAALPRRVASRAPAGEALLDELVAEDGS